MNGKIVVEIEGKRYTIDAEKREFHLFYRFKVPAPCPMCRGLRRYFYPLLPDILVCGECYFSTLKRCEKQTHENGGKEGVRCPSSA